MTGRVALLAAIGLLIAAPAYAQMRGGGGGGGGGGGHGGGGGGGGGSHSSSSHTLNAPPSTPVNQIEIVGVVTGLDAATSRITIAYEPVEALNWPRGTMPFPVTSDDLLKVVTVGEKVRFKVDSHQIYDIKPY